MPPPPAKRRSQAVAPVAIDPALYANIGRYAGSVVMGVFEQIGGQNRMAEWADENPTEFYKSIFTKVISAPRQVEVTGKVTIEEAVKALDLAEGDGYHVVEDGDISEHHPSGDELSEDDF